MLRPRPTFVLASITVFGLALGCGGGSDDPALPDSPPAPVYDAPQPAEPCAEPTGAGTMHSAQIAADETWTAADSPHVVTFDMAIQGATLTVEPCAVVRIRNGYSISIGRSVPDDPPSALVAHGEVVTVPGTTPTSRPVIFMPDEPGTHWGSLRVFSSGSVDLELVELLGAGEQSTAPNGGGAIVSGGGGGGTGPLNRNVRVVNVLVADTGGLGVNLQDKAAFTADSRDLTITGAGQQSTEVITAAPIRIAPPAVQTIPSGTYTGNALDEILVATDAIFVDETFPARGVPYRLLGGLSLAPLLTQAEGGLATLTIEAGVTIKVIRNGGGDAVIALGNSNDTAATGIWPVRVIADGTAAPIIFTSAEDVPVAGDWAGIEWGGGPPTGNVMRNVHIEYAGGNSGTQGFGCGPNDNDAALIIRQWHPTEAFITGSTILNSASTGIVSGWTSDDDGPNFKTGNTFTGIANACDVGRWKNVTAPACPSLGVTPDCL